MTRNLNFKVLSLNIRAIRSLEKKGLLISYQKRNVTILFCMKHIRGFEVTSSK